MNEQRIPNVAILGAGPIGLEAALYARQLGWNVDVYERDVPGAHLKAWGHVEFFSPWNLNRSTWSESYLEEQGLDLPDGEDYPTGASYVDQYLMPLVESELLDGCIHAEHEVLGVARRHALKSEYIGADEREAGPFQIHLRTPDGERYAHADVVFDATGVYRIPNGLGPGGLAALGESAHADRINYYIPDVLGDDRDRYTGVETLVVGAGYSAVTTVRHLHELADSTDDTRVRWLLRDDEPPYALIPDDPLPVRRELSEFGNDVVAGRIDGVSNAFGTIERIDDTTDGRLAVELVGGEALECDEIVANVGYRPDVELFRELQVHQCYATEGPIDLAASLLSSSAGSADCLDQSSGGVELLETPEPKFFVLGSKSYGRNSSFLLKVGYEQIEQIFDKLTP